MRNSYTCAKHYYAKDNKSEILIQGLAIYALSKQYQLGKVMGVGTWRVARKYRTVDYVKKQRECGHLYYVVAMRLRGCVLQGFYQYLVTT
jgi:hypothetical protein